MGSVSMGMSTPMRVLTGMVVVVVLLIMGAITAGFFLPDRASMQREIVIDAPPATVFTLLSGFRRFNEWSPWADLDPATTYTLEGPVLGVGARHSWASQNESVGAGSQEIVEAVPYSSIRVRLTFSGIDSANLATYTLTPKGAGTNVVWHHQADFKGDLLGRYFGLMLDSMLGADYERGLARLKTLAESLPKADFSGLEVERVTVSAMPIAYVAGRSSTDSLAIGKAYAAAYTRIGAAMSAARLETAGPVLVIGRKWDAAAGVYEFDAAVPVRGSAGSLPPGEVKLGRTYAGEALKAIHKGPYSGLSAHFDQLVAFKATAGYLDNGNPWDVFVSDPVTTPEAELITETYLPIR